MSSSIFESWATDHGPRTTDRGLRTTKEGASMGNASVVFELTDGEIRAFWFSVPSLSNLVRISTAVKFDRIPIPTGLVVQGNVQDENALINILLTYATQHPYKIRKAYLAIPLQQGFIRAYTLPWLSKRDRKSAIPLLVDEEISIRSDLLYDFLVVYEEKHKSLQILLGAIRHTILERYVFIFGQAGFKVTDVDFTFSVLGQALGFEPKEDVLYLQGESDCFQMALFRGAVPESVRTLLPLQRPLPLPLTEGNSGGGVNQQMEEWGNEIRRFLLYNRTQQPDLNLKRVVWSGNSVADRLAQGLVASSHVSAAEQARIKGVPGSWFRVFEENKGLCEVAVGYALRIVTHRPALNLWSQPYTVQKLKQKYSRLAFFNVTLLMIGTIIWFLLYQMALPLQQESEALSLQGSRIEVKAKQQEALQTSWNKMKAQSERIGERLAQVLLVKGNGLKIEQVIYKQGNMSLSGSGDDAREVQTLIHTLRAMEWVQPALSSYKLTSQNKVEFSLSSKSRRIGTDPVNRIQSKAENLGASSDGEEE